LQLAEESLTLPIRAQGVQRPVAFFVPSEARPLQLVFTQVGKNQVAGYLVMPASAD
jgi:hypothetical protein